MDRNIPQPPRLVHQVMVSSTFTDLKEHRASLIEAIHKHKLRANVMEHDYAKASADVIDSSLSMVRDSAAYILIIGMKYGQVPEDASRNPDGLSITELEFNEAQRLGRPILLLIMGDDHPVKRSDLEKNPNKEKKLDAFRTRAKFVSPEGKVNRIYAAFNSFEEFSKKISSSLNDLCELLKSNGTLLPNPTVPPEELDPDSIPKAPAFYSEPPYIGSHAFVGRESQLQELSDWANPADPTNLLLFEAIGGNGKSMLTWEWVTNPRHAQAARPDDSPWAGRFWYSFYERGAIMADFCRRALAYMTGRPLKAFAKKKTTEMAKDLLFQLHARPWLIVLDGLERVLVAYHRIDAAEVPDEEANAPTDKIVDRNPCDAIREEDNDLLRALAGARPSKVLVSSRLTPRVFLNPSGQAIPGARRIDLPGLRPADAEALLRSCGRAKDTDPGIRGDFAAIRSYLAENCDNHPLVIGVLGGLINNYLPDRGNFDAWVADPDGGSKLDFSRLDLIQRRNHVLLAAFDALTPDSRQLLSTLTLLSESVDYETLKALNPHLPPELEDVEKPEPPKDNWDSDEEKAEYWEKYYSDLTRWTEHEKAVQARLNSAEYRAAPRKLGETVRDLEQRGLLQWDGRDRKYNLHPVVRGVAAGGMQGEDRERYGRRVVNYFSSLPHNPYEQAETLDDLRPGLQVVRTLLKLGHLQQATEAYQGDLAHALLYNVEAYAETLSLLRPFFPTGWDSLPLGVKASDAAYLAHEAANILYYCGEREAALVAYTGALRSYLETEDWDGTCAAIHSVSDYFRNQNRRACAMRVNAFELDLAVVLDNQQGMFQSRLALFDDQAALGQWSEAAATWRLLDPMDRAWSRRVYRPGVAEEIYARFQFYRGTLEESHLATAERQAVEGMSRATIRDLHRLRGAWRLERDEWSLAAASFAEALRMARERGLADANSETGLALARLHLSELAEPRREAERLAQLLWPSDHYLARLWLDIGDYDQARRHALNAYRWAWGEGEPYVHRYELNRATELLCQLDVPIPDLPPYDPAKSEPFSWEVEVHHAIKSMRMKASGASQALLSSQDWIRVLEAPSNREFRQRLIREVSLRPAAGFPCMKMVSFRLRNITVFEDTGITPISIHSDCTLLLGDNATGKSTILKCLTIASLGLAAANESLLEEDARSFLRQGAEWGAIEVQFRLFTEPTALAEEGETFIVGLRVDTMLKRFGLLSDADLTEFNGEKRVNSLEGLSILRNDPTISFGFVCAYGPSRNLTDNRDAGEPEYGSPEREWVVSMFRQDAPLTRSDGLRLLIRGETGNIKGAPNHLSSTDVEKIRRGIAKLMPAAKLTPIESSGDVSLHGVELMLHQLSDGYRSVFAFVGHILRSALRQLTWQGDPFSVHGVALIDELDAHLHPIWQRHVLEDLQAAFPNVQFIASTHSALLIAPLKHDNILVTHRESDGGVYIRNPQLDPQGMGFEGILKSEIFGLRSTVDSETLRKIDERNILYAKGDLRTPEEGMRLSELSQALSRMGFAMDFKDPYYALFVTSMARHTQFNRPTLNPAEMAEQDRIAGEVIDDLLAGELNQ